MWPFSLKDTVCSEEKKKKKDTFLVVNDVHVSAIPCSYSPLEIISITIQYGLYWFLFLEFTRVRMRPADWAA